MTETMVQVRSSMREQQQSAASTVSDSSTPAIAPPPSHRRPRVREVSSRFMSPVVASSSSGDLHLSTTKSPLPKLAVSTAPDFPSRHQLQRSNSAQWRRHQELEPLSCGDENRPETLRSLDTPLGSNYKQVVPMQRKQRGGKLFKENGGRGEPQNNSDTRFRTSDNCKLSGRSSNTVAFSRVDTPMVSTAERMISSRLAQKFPQSTDIVAAPVSTAAAKLLQSNGMLLSAQSSDPISKVDRASLSDDDGGKEFVNILAKHASSSVSTSSACSPILTQKCKTRTLRDRGSSSPDSDMSSTVSTRLLPADRNCSSRSASANAIGGDFSKVSTSTCSRSLNLLLSSCEQSILPSIRTSEKPASVLNTSSSSIKMGDICLPPLPPCTKIGADAKKGKKVSNHQEDIHSLRLLHNHYLRWRFANAKAAATMHSQRNEAERTLYSLGVKISELKNSVKLKCIDLATLQRTNTLSSIIEAQMPYLDEWSALEGDYSSSLSEIIQALSNASLQLPIGGNIRVDVRGIEDALEVAMKVLEVIIFNVQNFMAKTKDMDSLISELAGVIDGERVFVEECGDLLSKTHSLQVEECSLRSQLIQYQRSSLALAHEE